MKRLLVLLFAASSLTAFGQLPDYVPTEGLVAYYPFDVGLEDVSGMGNNGSGSVGGFVEGLVGSAAQFTGNEVVDLPMSISFEQRSLAMWVRVESIGWQLIFSDDHSGLDHGHSLVGYGIPEMPTTVGMEFGTAGANQDWDLDSWIHVAAVRNVDSTMYFFNGALASVVASDTYKSNSGVSNARIGADRTGGRKFTGSVDDLVIYDVCLTENQVLGLFLLSIPQPGCMDADACNFNPEATFDDDSCELAGCMDEQACNFIPLALCDDGSCDYTCCPGPGCCSVGHYWDWEVGKCFDINPGDINLDGCVQLNDLLDLLSAYGNCGADEEESGYALSFDGVNGHVDFGNASIGNVEDVTFEVLMKTGSDSEGLGSNYQALLSKDCNGCEFSTGDWAILIGHNGNGVASFTINNSSGVAAVESGALNDDEWHWISVTRNATTGLVHLFVDGVEIDSDIGPIGLVHNEEKMYLAKYFPTNPKHYEGLVGELRVWNRELTGVEIGTYLGAELQGNESGLVGLWNFSEGEGDVLTDQTNGGLNGQIIEATWTSATETH